MLPVKPLPPGLRVEDTCDYCFRAFARMRGLPATCPNCGLDNVRQGAFGVVSSNMLSGGTEQAVLSATKPKPRRRRK